MEGIPGEIHEKILDGIPERFKLLQESRKESHKKIVEESWEEFLKKSRKKLMEKSQNSWNVSEKIIEESWKKLLEQSGKQIMEEYQMNEIME